MFQQAELAREHQRDLLNEASQQRLISLARRIKKESVRPICKSGKC